MLITTAAQFQAYVTIDKGISIEILRSHVRNAERQYIIPALGTTLYDLLDAYGGTGNATYDALLIKVREPLALLAMNTLVRDVAVQVGDAGASVMWSESYRPALADQISNKLDALQVCGMSALDALYDYLQSTNPASWRASTAGAESNATLLRNSREFSLAFPINNSRTTFMDLRPAMLRAQDFDIGPAISATYLETLLTYNASPSPADTYKAAAIAKLQKALAHLAISRADDVVLKYVNGGLVSTRFVMGMKDGDTAREVVSAMKVNAGTNGRALLAQAQKYMDENAANLAGYTARTDHADLPDTASRIHNGDGYAAF